VSKEITLALFSSATSASSFAGVSTTCTSMSTVDLGAERVGASSANSDSCPPGFAAGAAAGACPLNSATFLISVRNSSSWKKASRAAGSNWSARACSRSSLTGRFGADGRQVAAHVSRFFPVLQFCPPAIFDFIQVGIDFIQRAVFFQEAERGSFRPHRARRGYCRIYRRRWLCNPPPDLGEHQTCCWLHLGL